MYFYYEFEALPDLGDDEWWIMKHNPTEEFTNSCDSVYLNQMQVPSCLIDPSHSK